MRCAEVLAALAFRRSLACSPQLVGSAERSVWAEDLFARCTLQTIAGALHWALTQTWLAMEIVLAGEELWRRIQSASPSEAESNFQPLRSFLNATTLERLDCNGFEARRHCWQALLAAQQEGLVNTNESGLPEEIHQFVALNYSDWSDLREAEWREIGRLGEELEQAGHGGLQPLLELRWQRHDSLLVVLAAVFFRYALEADSSAAFAPHDSLLEGGFEEGRELASVLDRYHAPLSAWLEALRPASVSRGATATNPTAASVHYERGFVHLQHGEYERAIAEFTSALRFDPTLADAFVNRGEAYRLAGDYEHALADYDIAHLLDPANDRLLFNRGMVHWIMGQFEAAIADYTTCLRLNVNNALAYTNRGTAHADKGDLESALADFSRALQLDSSSHLAYQKRGDLFVRKGDYDRAIADYTQVFRLNPYDALTYVKRGDAYRFKGQHDRALADYGNAIRLDPLNVGGYLNRAAAYRLRGQHELVLVDLSQAIQLDSGNSRIWSERALAHRALNNHASALADFDRALQLNPTDAELFYQRGCTYQQSGDLSRAVEDFNVAIRLKPDFALAYHNRGCLHVAREDIDAGITDFGAAIRFDANFCQAYLSRASAWSKKGRFDKAISDCDEALQRDSTLGGAYVVRGSAHVQQGAYERAHADFERALSLDPQNAQVYHLRGLTAMKQGQYDKALTDLTESLRLNANNARALFLRGTVHQLREQHDEALTDFHQAVLLDPQQYTAAYCNQRALIHAARGQYELALADFAIVLQLDPTNVTALVGREETLQALKAQPPPTIHDSAAAEAVATSGVRSQESGVRSQESGIRTAHDSASAEAAATPAATSPKPSEARPKRKKPKTREHPAAQTQLMRVSKSTATLPALPSDLLPAETTEGQPPAEAPAGSEVVELTHVEEIALEALIDKTVEAPPPVGETVPDRAVELPETAKTADDISLQPADSAREENGTRPLGPMEARTVREQQDAEKSERAKLWAEMRYRERQAQLAREQQESAAERKRYSRGDGSGGKLIRRTIVVLLGLAVLSAAGFGVYSMIFAKRDIKINAVDAWNEFAKNNEQANQKYKEYRARGKFLRVTGKLKIYKTEKTTQLFFVPPNEDAKWFIKISLQPKDTKDLQPDQEITVRGQFSPRKTEDSNLDMSNCSLIKEK